MNVKLLSKAEEPLFSRTMLDLELAYETATPSRSDIKQAVASAQSTTPNLVVIRKINQSFGSKTARVTSYVYKKEEDLKAVESDVMINKGVKKEKNQ